MSAKAIVSGALILAVLGGRAARAAEPAEQAPPAPEVLPVPAPPPSQPPLPDVIPAPSQIPAVRAGLPPGSVPDPWITYDRPGCCGPVGSSLLSTGVTTCFFPASPASSDFVAMPYSPCGGDFL